VATPDPPEYVGRVVRVRREHYRLPDGREASLDAVRYRNVATVVPLLADGRVVLLRQFRPIVGADWSPAKTRRRVPAGSSGRKRATRQGSSPPSARPGPIRA
jgi:hypothetical protein